MTSGGPHSAKTAAFTCRAALTSHKTIVTGELAKEDADDLVFRRSLIERHQLRAIIDRCPLVQVVEAHRYVDQGHKKGTSSSRFSEPVTSHEGGFERRSERGASHYVSWYNRAPSPPASTNSTSPQAIPAAGSRKVTSALLPWQLARSLQVS